MSNVRIVEQPAAKSFRFRYESEGRKNGFVLGATSTKTKITYPAIEITNYTGDIIVIISCVTHKQPYKQHPHKLTSKGKVSTGGIYSLKGSMTQSKMIEFKDIGVVFVKKNNISASLTDRKSKNIDPTRGGWSHINEARFFDLQKVRLCFQVLAVENGILRALGAVVSNELVDKRSNNPLKILELSDCNAPASGGKKIILLSDKVKNDDIAIVFYEEDVDGNITWKKKLTLANNIKVHHQYAISFRTPQYRDLNISEPKRVFVHLYRPSSQESGEALPFEFLPSEQSFQLKRKRQKTIHDAVKPSLICYANELKKQEPQKQSNYLPIFSIIENLEETDTRKPIAAYSELLKTDLVDLSTPAEPNSNKSRIDNNKIQSNAEVLIPMQTKDVSCSNCYRPPPVEQYQQALYTSNNCPLKNELGPSNDYYGMIPPNYNNVRQAYPHPNMYQQQYYYHQINNQLNNGGVMNNTYYPPSNPHASTPVPMAPSNQVSSQSNNPMANSMSRPDAIRQTMNDYLNMNLSSLSELAQRSTNETFMEIPTDDLMHITNSFEKIDL